MPASKINLLPQKDFEDTIVGRFLRWSLTYGRYIIICTEVIVLLAFIYRFSLDRKVTDLEEEIEQKTAIILANREFEKQFLSLKQRTEEIGGLLVNENLFIGIVRQLETITPTNVRYEDISFSEENVQIHAIADTSLSLALFLDKLKSAPYLSQVNITELRKLNTGSGETVFTINANINSGTLLK